MGKLHVDRSTAELLKLTQTHMGLSERELLEKFICLAKAIVRKKRNRSLIHYYPANTIKRLRQDQFKAFLDECAKEGLLKKYGDKYIVDWPGKACIFTDDPSLLIPAYERAVEKLQRLYVDVLI